MATGNVNYKKTRRGTKKKPKDVKIWYCNINGFKTKQESVRKIVDNLQPKIIVMCETKLPSGLLIKKVLPEYEVCPRETKAGQGGIAIAVKTQTFEAAVLDVTNTENKNILAARVKMTANAIRIIAGYAPQETETVELREQFFNDLESEIMKCEMDGEIPLVIGDMNAKLEERNGEVVPLTPNGKLLFNIACNRNLDILNHTEKCKGRWTHVIRTTGIKSALDYCMTSQQITKHVTDVVIDEQCVFCPFRLVRERGREIPKYSDHNAMVIRLEIEHEKQKAIVENKGWIISGEGLEKFKNISDSITLTSDVNTPQELYNELEKQTHRAMDVCFKKRKSRKEPRMQTSYYEKYKKITTFGRKGKAQRRVAKGYIKLLVKANTDATAELRNTNLVETLKNLTIDNEFSPDKFWKLCKKSRNSSLSSTSIQTEDGVELYGEEQIRKAYRDEFIHRLRQRSMIPELKGYEEKTNKMCALYLELSKRSPIPNYDRKELESIYSGLKKGKSPGRDKIPAEIYVNGGENFQKEVITTLNSLKNNMHIPQQWEDILMPTIYKNKGTRKRIVNQRGIFLKQVLSKIFGRLNKNRISPELQNISHFQAGSKTERGPADQTFLLRGQIDHHKYLNKPLILTLYDFEQCFDSLWLEDCLLSLRKLGVQNEILNILYNMNSKCNIMVKTPVGLTEEFTVESIVQQGSVCGGTLCTAATGEVVEEITEGGCQIGELNVKALVYVDDIIAVNRDTQDAYNSHEKIMWFSRKKRLTVNVPKCLVMMVNGKVTDVTPRLKIDGVPLSKKAVATYLGDQFNEKGDNKDLIEERKKKGQICLVTSLSMCSDITMGLFTIQTMMVLYRSLFLQVVLYNAQAWSNLTKQDITVLKTIQLKFLKRIFHAPSSTSNPLTFLETGTLPIEQEIHKRQLAFLHHILSLQNNDPVKMSYNEQLKYECAQNWANEVKQIRETYGIRESDTEIITLSRKCWKYKVKTTISKHTIDMLTKELSNQKQYSVLPMYSELKPQEYLYSFPPAKARTLFHIRTGTVDVKAVRKYRYNDTVCRLCGTGDENIDHIANHCTKITRTHLITDVYANQIDDMAEVVNRYNDFTNKLDELGEK